MRYHLHSALFREVRHRKGVTQGKEAKPRLHQQRVAPSLRSLPPGLQQRRARRAAEGAREARVESCALAVLGDARGANRAHGKGNHCPLQAASHLSRLRTGE